MKYFGEIFALVADLLHRCLCLLVMTLMWEQEIDLVFAQTAAEIASAERTHTHTHTHKHMTFGHCLGVEYQESRTQEFISYRCCVFELMFSVSSSTPNSNLLHVRYFIQCS